MFNMKYSTGDTVKFRLKSGEIQEGEVIIIEKRRRGDVLYVNGFNRMAYRVDEKRVISPEKNKLVQLNRLKNPAVKRITWG